MPNWQNSLPSFAPYRVSEKQTLTSMNTDPAKKNRHISNGIWVTIGFAINSVAGLVILSFLTHMLIPEDVGTYFLAFSFATTGAIFLQLGMNRSVVSHVGRASSPHQLANARKTIIFSIQLILFACISVYVIFGTGLGNRLLESAYPEMQLSSYTQVLIIWASLLALRGISAESFRGLHDIKNASIIERMGTSVSLITLLAVLGYAGHINTFKDALALTIICLSLVLFFAIFSLIRKLNELPRDGKISTRDYLRSSLPLLSSQILVIIMNQSPLWILGSTNSGDEVAVFSTAMRAALLTSMPLLITNNVIMPTVAKLYAENKSSDLSTLLKITVIIAALPSTFAFIVLLVFGEHLLGIVFDEHYQTAYYPLLIISFGCLMNVFSGSASILLAMSHHEKLILKNTLISALFIIAFGLITIPNFGTTGAALTFAGGLIFYNILLVITCKKHLQINTHISITGMRLLLNKKTYQYVASALIRKER